MANRLTGYRAGDRVVLSKDCGSDQIPRGCLRRGTQGILNRLVETNGVLEVWEAAFSIERMEGPDLELLVTVTHKDIDLA